MLALCRAVNFSWKEIFFMDLNGVQPDGVIKDELNTALKYYQNRISPMNQAVLVLAELRSRNSQGLC